MQYQAYCTLHIPFVIKGSITVCDHIRKTAWYNGLIQYISSNSHLNYSDFTTINGALEIAATLNIKIGRIAITNLITSSNCGFRLSGRRGQWSVDAQKITALMVGRI